MLQDLSGKQVGNYELRDRLGRGGMAEVYRAYQAGMDRFVAIKIMLSHLVGDEQFVERFRREARAVGKLRHAHIVQVFDFGMDDGVYYMVMEHIRGGNLKALIQGQGKLNAAHALKIASQLADALAYAHGLGMIHRDLKPANVMFTDDEYQHSILTDFGIARILTETGITLTGMAVGTPAYMSPEAGLGQDIDERSDLYALGVMIYEMLAGTTPYTADTPLAVIMKHVNAPLPSLKGLGDDVPEVIEHIILRGMAKDPADRYANALEMKAAIDAALLTITTGAPTKPATMVAPGAAAAKPAPRPKAQPAVPAAKSAIGQQQTATPNTTPNNTVLYAVLGVAMLILAVMVVFLALELNEDDDSDATAQLPTGVVIATEEQQAQSTPPPPPPTAPPPPPTNNAQQDSAPPPSNQDDEPDEPTEADVEREALFREVMDAARAGEYDLAHDIAVEELTVEYEDELDSAQYADLAYIALEDENPAQAWEWAERALAENERNGSAHYITALIAWQWDANQDEATLAFNRARNEGYTSPFLQRAFDHDVDVDFARMLADFEAHREAIAYYDTALANYPDWAELHVDKAVSLIELEEWGPAEATLRDAERYAETTEVLGEIRELRNALPETFERGAPPPRPGGGNPGGQPPPPPGG